MIIRRDAGVIDLGQIVEAEAGASALAGHSWAGRVPQPDGSHRKMKFVVSHTEKHSVKTGDRVPMLVSLKALDHHWSKDKGYYVGPGEESVKGRRAGVERHFAKADEVNMPRVDEIDKHGVVSIGDGRHRLAVLRDRGVTHTPVLVPRERVDQVRQTFRATHKALTEKPS